MALTKPEQIIAELSLPETSWRQTCLVATFGLPGTGKTTVAHHLSERYPLVVLSTDAIRLKYGFDTGPDTIQAMHLVAERLFAQDYSVLFDGVHMMRRNRDAIRQFAELHHTMVRFAYVTADDAIIRQRLDERLANPEKTVNEGKFVITPEHFQRIAHYCEAPDGEDDIVIVDTSPGQPPLRKQLQSLTNDLQRWL